MGLAWYHDGMVTTIDKAGRVVIPLQARERAGLAPGAVLQVSVDDTGIRLERIAAGPTLLKVGRRLVAKPAAGGDRPAVDVAALVDDERNRWP
jgi:AbrB family looped-hinge helix DNA binding protein